MFITANIKRGQLIGEYGGKPVLRMQVTEPELSQIKDEVPFAPSKKVPHLHVLPKPDTAPPFMAKKDTYVAWSVLRQTVETEQPCDWQLTGNQGAEIGFDGVDGGNLKKYKITRPDSMEGKADWNVRTLCDYIFSFIDQYCGQF